MMHAPTCPACRSSLPAAGGPCPVCEATRTSAPDDCDATRTSAPASHNEFLATVTRGADPVELADGYRFAPGDLLGDRYRIVQPLGKGGMGEVYRADDLSLGVSVALKILPERLATNPAWLNRFRKEVAAARQVSHPHVCRVYDIAEVDGLSMLSMEFIAGDDLAAIVRKVRRLSSGLAIDLVRQIARGLDAVHDEGLVHRDLKPANVMIDGRGRAKLADFGLAATAASVQGHDAYAGTPAYQAPEQLAGGELSERTDLYALGVLAYELLAGRRPYATTDRDGLIRAQKELPPPPSAFDASVPPEVDRVVLKCLAPDPLNRPASAAEVFRTLPGDAALNAALAAGVTPTAEAVADAGGEGRLSRRAGVVLGVATLVLGLLVAVLQIAHEHGHDRDWEPSRLLGRGQDLLAKTGHPTDLPYSASGYEPNWNMRDWRNQNDRALDRASPDALDQLPSNSFMYRVSTVPIVPRFPVREQPIVFSDDPPLRGPLFGLVVQDARGRLDHLIRMPPAARPSAAQAPPDWAAWFREAGFDLMQFRPVAPSREWIVPHDACYAWEGVFPGRPSIPVTVEAATDRGELVAFHRIAPWSVPESWERTQEEFRARYQFWWVFLPAVMLVAGGWKSWRNIRAGTADVRGAVRLAVGFGVIHLIMYVVFVRELRFGGTAVHEWYEIAARILLNSVRIGVGYLALEPSVRRHWPWRLIGWRRLLDGRLTDPKVGRDILLGLFFAGGVMTLIFGLFLLPAALGLPPELPSRDHKLSAFPVGFAISTILTGVDSSLLVLFVIYFLTRLLRTPFLWLPLTFAILIFGPFGGSAGANPAILRWMSILITAIALVILLRFGLLTLIVTWVGSLIVGGYPLLAGWGTWYWPNATVGCVSFLTCFVYALVTSVGGWRRLVRGDVDA